MQENQKERWYTINEYADKYGYARITVYKWCQEGVLKTKKEGRNILILDENDPELENYNLYKITEYAKKKGLSYATVYNKCKDGKLKSFVDFAGHTVIMEEKGLGDNGVANAPMLNVSVSQVNLAFDGNQLAGLLKDKEVAYVVLEIRKD